jgi:hypothetical protein
VCLGLGGAAVLVALVALPHRPGSRALLPAVLLAAARITTVGPRGGGGDARTAVAIALAVAAAGLAVACWRGRHSAPSAVLALAALAALALTAEAPTRPGGLLLASAAVLAGTIDHPAIALAALPGAAALVVAMGEATSPATAGTGAALAIAGVAIALTDAELTPPFGLPWPVVPAVAALLVLPSLWDWTGDARLDGYGQGVAVGLAAAALAAVARAVLAHRAATGAG